MFFQNPFKEDFKGNWVLGDRQQSITFTCPANKGRGDEHMCTWAVGPYDLSGNDDDGVSEANLTLYYAYDPNYKFFTPITIDVSAGAASTSAVTVREIIAALNANTTFFSLFEASLMNDVKVLIRHKRASMKSYVSNNGAETKLKFNGRAGVAELPIYFLRHTIGNRFTYTDCTASLVPLNHLITAISQASPAAVTSAGHGLTTGQQIIITGTNSDAVIDGTRTITSTGTDTFTAAANAATAAGNRGRYSTLVEAAIINNAVDKDGNTLGYSASSVKDDWTLLDGRSGLFLFKKNTIDGSSRVTVSIQYPAGAGVGDLAKMIKNTYTGAATEPTNSTEFPYVLTSGDLITPF